MVVLIFILPEFILLNPVPTTSLDIRLPETIPEEPLQGNTNNILANVPQAFTVNHGQLENHEVLFYDPGSSVWFSADGVWFELREYTEPSGQGGIRTENREWGIGNGGPGLTTDDYRLTTREYRGVVLKQEFIGANLVHPVGRERLGWNSNFFYGNDSSKWYTDVPNYAEVYYENLYDGIDLRYYSNEKGLKYDFIVHPGADIEQIKLKYVGVDKLEVDENGNLVIITRIKNLIDSGLFIYQEFMGTTQQIDGKFEIYNNFEFGYKIFQKYNKQEILFIDPSINLKYSTYLGGISSDDGLGVTVDQIGNVYLTGTTYSHDFPNTTGAFDNTLNGNSDVFVIKFNNNCSNIDYSTYIGGNNYESGFDIITNSSGEVFVTGYTDSTDFPITSGAFNTNYNGGKDDVFIFNLNPNGSTLLYSTFIGGKQNDYCMAITIDSLGNAIITGVTTSSDFPTTIGAYDTTYNLEADVFILKINQNGSKLLFSTYIGGKSDEFCYGIAVNSSNCIYVTGYTTSSDFPLSGNPYDNSFNGGQDVFILQLNLTGSNLLYSTFFGGTSNENSWQIKLDSNENIIITGETQSSNFPITVGAYNQIYNGGLRDVFILKFNKSFSMLLFSTFIGGSNIDKSFGLTIDLIGDIYITGYTRSLNFPTTQNAFDKTLNGTSDIFLTKLSSNGSKLIYSTYIGGLDTDNAQSIIIDSKCNVFLTGQTTSFDFPITNSTYDVTYNGGGDAYLLKFSFPPIFKIASFTLKKDRMIESIIYFPKFFLNNS